MAPAKNTLQKVLELAGTFVTSQKGSWNHDDWESFLTKISAQGVPVDDETKRNLGNIIEASKFFYHLPAAAPAKKKAASKKPAAKKPAAKKAPAKKKAK